MFLMSIIDGEPRLDTMPVIKTTEYPWTDDSFRPLCYCRCAVLRGRGVLFDLQAFERDPVVHESGELLDDSCVALSFCFFDGPMITAVLNAACDYQVYADGQPVDCALDVEGYSGVDEQGWYWGVRLVLPDTLLLRFYGEPEIPDHHMLKGNIYKFKRTGGRAHIGAAAQMTDPFIFSRSNLTAFCAVDY